MAMGRRLKRARLATGLSVRDVARITGISASTISRSENDQINSGLRADTFRKLALFYGLSMDYLLDDTILVPREEQTQIENVLRDVIVAFEQRFGVAVSRMMLVRSLDGSRLMYIHLEIEEGLADGGSEERSDLEGNSKSPSAAAGELDLAEDI